MDQATGEGGGRRRGISVRGKILGIFALAAAVMAGTLLFVLRASREIDHLTRSMVDHDVTAVKAVKEMENSLLAQESSLTRFVLTGDPRWLEQRDGHRTRFLAALRQVRAVAATAAEREVLGEIDAALPRHEEQVQRLLDLTGTSGLGEEARNLLRSANGALPEIYRRCETLLAIHEDVLQRNEQAADVMSDRYRGLGYLTVALIAAATLALGLLLRGIVLQPIRRLEEGARAYERGRLEHRVPVQGDDELGSLSRTFNEMAAALQKERGRLTEMSITDELTQLKNFRHFAARLEEEVRRAERYGHSLSLILFDVDHFKTYNDTHGHPAGNEVLRVVGRLLRDNARNTDILARYGGEEFAAILPETTKEDAVRLGEKILRLIELHSFPGEDALPGGRLTISAGVATVPDDSADSPLLLDAADRALYSAKNAGRNRVVAYARGMGFPRRVSRTAALHT